ncbi:uncharacterized protein LOC130284885 isoform X2 [Hyla sarda]|uniref:uncharacterized protein LOC130284885 isoform X2 n=1 Tax=Hyla sarda TaxID=327740 RepID=UPI0024C2D53B|nr:uncharacterized protein LOC130284885 isoform X2 [Hyla sarda]
MRKKRKDVTQVVPHYHQLFIDKSPCNTYSVRNAIWDRILLAANAVGVNCRTLKEIKKIFTDLRSLVKKKMGRLNQQRRRTSGGPPEEIHFSTIEELIKSTYSTEQIAGVGNLDLMALAQERRAQEIESQPSHAEDTTLANIEETENEHNMLDNQPTANPPDSNVRDDIGFTPAQASFLNDYTERTQANLKDKGIMAASGI